MIEDDGLFAGAEDPEVSLVVQVALAGLEVPADPVVRADRADPVSLAVLADLAQAFQVALEVQEVPEVLVVPAEARAVGSA